MNKIDVLCNYNKRSNNIKSLGLFITLNCSHIDLTYIINDGIMLLLHELYADDVDLE